MSYLIDTSWVVEYIRKNQNSITRLASIRDEGLAVIIISVAELYRGVFISTNTIKNESSLDDFLK